MCACVARARSAIDHMLAMTTADCVVQLVWRVVRRPRHRLGSRYRLAPTHRHRPAARGSSSGCAAEAFPLLALAPDLQHLVILHLPQLGAIRQLLRSCSQLHTLGSSPELQSSWLLRWRRGNSPLHLASKAGSERLIHCLTAEGLSPSDWSQQPPSSPPHQQPPNITAAATAAGFSTSSASCSSCGPSTPEVRLTWCTGPGALLLNALTHLPLHTAAFSGNAPALSALLSSSTHLINTPPRCTPAWESLALSLTATVLQTLPSPHTTPLHLAILGGHTRAAQLLIQLGADPNINPGQATLPGSPWGPRHSWPPLLHAVTSHQPGMAQLLLAGGADANAVHYGRPILHSAVWATCMQPTLHDRAWAACLEVVQVLLAAGAQPNARGLGAATSLHVATQWAVAQASAAGRAAGDCAAASRALAGELVGALLAGGADPDLLMDDGCTALHVAAQYGLRDVMEALLSGGRAGGKRASVDLQQQPSGSCALHLAAAHGHAAAVQALIDAGADVRLRLADGCTALHMAVEQGHVEVVHVLLAAGADPDVQSGSDGSTALHEAAWQGHEELVRALLGAGADPDLRAGEELRGALHLAAWRGHASCVTALLEGGADPELRCGSDFSAVQMAKQHRRNQVVAVLQAAAAALGTNLG